VQEISLWLFLLSIKAPRGSGTAKNPKNIWKKYWVMFCTGNPPHKKSCVPKLDFLPGQMHRSMSVSAQGFAKDNLHWVNSGDLTTGSITESKHHELIQ